MPHIDTDFNLEALWNWINPRTLFQLHLGYVGAFEKDLLKKAPKAVELFDQVEAVKSWVLKHPELMQPKAIWQFFNAKSQRDQIHIYAENGSLLHTWTFPRQANPPHLCLADYIDDTLGLFVATIGAQSALIAQEWLESGRYLDCMILQSLAVQTAESLAEFVHLRMRNFLGIDQNNALSQNDIIKANYTGKRFSFGYGACPDLSEQKALFHLLKAEQIGVQLTRLNLMRPQASVSALVFSNPDAIYFSVI